MKENGGNERQAENIKYGVNSKRNNKMLSATKYCLKKEAATNYLPLGTYLNPSLSQSLLINYLWWQGAIL